MTASSTRFSSAFFSAALSALGSTPSCFAASFSTAWLSCRGEPSCVAAYAPPAPATARPATAPAITLGLSLLLIRMLLSLDCQPEPNHPGVRAN